MSERPRVIRIERGEPSAAHVGEVAALLQRGGIVATPTDTVYGLLGSVNRPDALRRLVELKVRPVDKPFILIARNWMQVRNVTSYLPSTARYLGSLYWPGPLTLVLPADEDLPDEVKATGPTVAVRMPDDPLLQAILTEVRAALAAPSANLPGEAPSRSADDVVRTFGDRIDLVLDGGETDGDVASTIVNCTGSDARVVRVGRVVPSPGELHPH